MRFPVLLVSLKADGYEIVGSPSERVENYADAASYAEELGYSVRNVEGVSGLTDGEYVVVIDEDGYDLACDERSYGPNHCAKCGNECEHCETVCEDCAEPFCADCGDDDGEPCSSCRTDDACPYCTPESRCDDCERSYGHRNR